MKRFYWLGVLTLSLSMSYGSTLDDIPLNEFFVTGASRTAEGEYAVLKCARAPDFKLYVDTLDAGTSGTKIVNIHWASVPEGTLVTVSRNGLTQVLHFAERTEPVAIVIASTEEVNVPNLWEISPILANGHNLLDEHREASRAAADH